MQTPHLDVRFAGSAQPAARVGLIVPKHRHTVADRNRLRRQLRELIRIELLPHLGGGDALVRAKPGAYGVNFSGLRGELDSIRLWISAQGQR